MKTKLYILSLLGATTLLFSCGDSSEKNITTLYQKILPQIGEIMDASQEKKLWGRPQVGGSCTVRSLLSLIKSQLSKKEYLAVKEIILGENITKIYSKIKHGLGL